VFHPVKVKPVLEKVFPESVAGVPAVIERLARVPVVAVLLSNVIA
jgi:hypothetical protein